MVTAPARTHRTDRTDRTDTTDGAAAAQAAAPLRRVLRADAAVCAASGLLVLALADPLARLMVDERPGLVRLAGAVTLVASVDLGLMAKVRTSWLAVAGWLAAAGNAAWVAATVVFVAAGVFDPAGVAVALALAGATAWLARLELAGAVHLRRALGRS